MVTNEAEICAMVELSAQCYKGSNVQ